MKKLLTRARLALMLVAFLATAIACTDDPVDPVETDPVTDPATDPETDPETEPDTTDEPFVDTTVDDTVDDIF